MNKINGIEVNKNNSNFIKILKGSVFSIILSLIMIFIFCLVLAYTNIRENTIAPVVITITAISIFIGSIISTRNINKNGLVNGGAVGLIYILFIYFLSSTIFSGFYFSTKSLIMIFFAILAGMIGGILGINIGKK